MLFTATLLSVSHSEICASLGKSCGMLRRWARRLFCVLFDETGREFNYLTVHRVLKRNGHPDSLWQMFSEEF
ncbi:hypothetical protein [Candidatus Pyrohabitans sp.]